ncbi:MAG: hypothetical protein COA78_04265 [Blastopirellula sp.]|nr:MAG: hypothetical protein COA78_04265 [Blastopirellula sp.]
MSKMLNVLRRLDPFTDQLPDVPNTGLKVQAKPASIVGEGQSNVALVIEPERTSVEIIVEEDSLLPPYLDLASTSSSIAPQGETELPTEVNQLELQLEQANDLVQTRDIHAEQLESQIQMQKEAATENEQQILSKHEREVQAFRLEINTLKSSLAAHQLESKSLSQIIENRNEEIEKSHSQLYAFKTQTKLESQQTISKIAELEQLLESVRSRQDAAPTLSETVTSESNELQPVLSDDIQVQLTKFETVCLQDMAHHEFHSHVAALANNIVDKCHASQQKTLLFVDIDTPEQVAKLTMQLSLVLSKMPLMILLIDAATETRHLTKSLDSCEQSGLRETLIKNVAWTENVVQLTSGPIDFLSSGNYTFSMTSGHKQATHQLLEEASRQYDLILIAADSSEAASSRIFASQVDAVYLSACLGRTNAASVSKVANDFYSLGAKIEGTIATNVPRWCYT